MARLGILLVCLMSPAFAQEAVSGAVSDIVQARHFKKCKKFGNCGSQGGYGGFQGGYGGYQGGNGGNYGGYPGSPINIAISQSQSSANGADGGHSYGYYPNNHQYNGGYPGAYNQGSNRPGYYNNGQGSYNNQFNGNYYGPQGGFGGPQGGYGGYQGGYGGYQGGYGGYQGGFGRPFGGYGFQKPIYDEASDDGAQHDEEHFNDHGNNLPGSDYDGGSFAGAVAFSNAGRSNH